MLSVHMHMPRDPVSPVCKIFLKLKIRIRHQKAFRQLIGTTNGVGAQAKFRLFLNIIFLFLELYSQQLRIKLISKIKTWC